MSAPSRRTMEISLGALFIVALIILGFMATRMGSLAGFGDVLTVHVRLDDANGLVEDASVKIAGVEVGRVKRLAIDFDHAVVDLQIKRSAGVRRDAIVAIRARSLLGEKFVEIEPRTREAPLVEDGETLEAEVGGLALEELASVLGPTVEALEVEEISKGTQRVIAMVERQEEPIATILKRIDAILTKVEALPLDDPAMIDDVRVSLRGVRGAVDALPALLASAQATVDTTRAAAERLDPLLSRVDASTADLPQIVAEARQTVTRLNGILAILEPQAKRLEDVNYGMVRYLFREEGLLVRFLPREVEDFDPDLSWERGGGPPMTPADPEIRVPWDETDREQTSGPMSQTPP